MCRDDLYLRGRRRPRWLMPALMGLSLAVVGGSWNGLRAATSDLCEGFPGSRTIRSMGGVNAFSRPPVSSVAELGERMSALAPDIREVFRQAGQPELAEPFLAAIASGQGVRESGLQPGTNLTWMAWRKTGRPRSSSNLCVATAGPQPAFQVEVRVEHPDSFSVYDFLIPKVCLNFALVAERSEPKPVPKPVCVLRVERQCQDGRWRVDATGSSPGATVTMTGPTGKRTVIAAGAGSMVWEGADADPYAAFTFEVVGESRARDGALQRCAETREAPPCPVPQAACSIGVDADATWAGRPVQVSVSGHWAAGGLRVVAVDEGGVEHPVNGPFPTSFEPAGPGRYSLRGTATNEAGASSMCAAEVVARPRRILRGFVAQARPGGDTVRLSTFGIEGGGERTSYSLGNGEGLGASFELRFGRRLGLEVAAISTDLDSLLKLDRGESWDMDRDRVGFLPLTIGPNVHLTGDHRVDVYAGPFVGHTILGQGRYHVLDESRRVDFGDELTWGLQVGLDVPFRASSAWGLHAGIRYLDLSAEGETGEPFDIDVDPVILGVGVSRKF